MAGSKKKVGANKSRWSQGWATRRANAEALRKLAAENENMTEAGLRKLAASAKMSAAAGSINQALYGDNAPQMGAQEIPGKGDIVGGHDDQMAMAIVDAARKKTGDVIEHVKRMVQVEAQRSRAEGLTDERERMAKIRELQARIMSDRIVCGFVSEFKDSERSNGIPYEMIWTLNSLTVTKVVEALERAGYTPQGKVRSLQE